MRSKAKIMGDRIKRLREDHGETQSDIAEVLNYKTHQQVSYLETGQRRLNINQLVILAKHFNVSADYLLGLTNAATTNKDLQFVCKYTGLDEAFVLLIREQNSYTLDRLHDVLKWIEEERYIANL